MHNILQILDVFSIVSSAVCYDVWALVQADAEQRLNQTELEKYCFLLH